MTSAFSNPKRHKKQLQQCYRNILATDRSIMKYEGTVSYVSRQPKVLNPNVKMGINAIEYRTFGIAGLFLIETLLYLH